MKAVNKVFDRLKRMVLVFSVLFFFFYPALSAQEQMDQTPNDEGKNPPIPVKPVIPPPLKPPSERTVENEIETQPYRPSVPSRRYAKGGPDWWHKDALEEPGEEEEEKNDENNRREGQGGSQDTGRSTSANLRGELRELDRLKKRPKRAAEGRELELEEEKEAEEEETLLEEPNPEVLTDTDKLLIDEDAFKGEEQDGEEKDMDGDGIPDGEDEDIDGDGVPNEQDLVYNAQMLTEVKVNAEAQRQQIQDTDGDGIADADDPDIDDDGIPNQLDPDTNGDGIPDADKLDDRDGDGTPDQLDPDADGDGVPNEEDSDPDDPRKKDKK